MKAKIQSGVDTLNQVIEQVALPWMKMSKAHIPTKFAEVFCLLNDTKLVLHLIDKFSSDKDFARFYLNADDEIRRVIFEHYDIPLDEQIKQTALKRFTALASEKKSRWEVFPFQSELVNQFYLMAYNNSLFLLKDISVDAWEHFVKRKLDAFGNGKNWSKAWTILTDNEKEAIVEYLITTKF